MGVKRALSLNIVAVSLSLSKTLPYGLRQAGSAVRSV